MDGEGCDGGDGGDAPLPSSPPPLFGYRRFVPAWLQRVNRAQVFEALLCLFAFSQSFPPNGLLNANTSETLKRRYGFSSTQLGLFGAAYDLLAAVAIVPLCHYASKGHKPRYLAAAIAAITVGTLMMSVPHFAIGAPVRAGVDGDGDGVGNATAALESTGPTVTQYFCIFLSGQCVASYGGIALLTLGTVFVEENVLPRQLPLYLGLFMGCSALGSVLGFVVSGLFLTGRREVEDQRWISAWWVAFVASIVVGLVMLVIFLGYPEELPSGRKLHAEVLERRPRLPPLEGFVSNNFASLPHHTLALLRNRAYMCLTLGSTVNVAAQCGIDHFLSSFLEIRFEQIGPRSLKLANLVTLPAAAGGCIVGGVVPTVLNCSYQTLLNASFVLSTACLLLSPMFWMHCERPFLPADTNRTLSSWRGLSNGGAGGDEAYGCSNRSNGTLGGDDGGGCDLEPSSVECAATYAFLFVVFCAVFATFAKHVWSTVLTLHVVPDGYQFYALGLQTIFAHLAGSGPATVIFGYLFDDVRARDEAMRDGLVTAEDNMAAYADYAYRRQALSRNMFVAYALLFLAMAIAGKVYKLPIAEEDKEEQALRPTLPSSEETELIRARQARRRSA